MWQTLVRWFKKLNAFLYRLRTHRPPTPISEGEVLIIALVNKSTQPVNVADLKAMVAAVNAQLRRQVAPAWDRNPASVIYVADESHIPAGGFPLYLFDDADQAGALGYHTEDPNGNVYGRVFVNPVLHNGGAWLTGAQYTVSATFSHEACELFIDPSCVLWAQANDGTLYALEVSDPVENDSYTAKVGTTAVDLSNFVYPEWFDPQAPAHGRFDQLKKLSQPFTMDAGGYVVYMQGGQVNQKYGDNYPEWRKAGKEFPAARTARRKS